jgi:hypothetical protein
MLRARLMLRAFTLLEQSGYPAIPELKRLMNDTNDLVWQKANLALASMRGEGLRALAEGLPDQNAPQARIKVQNIAFSVASFKGALSLSADDRWQRNYITNTVRELVHGDFTNAAQK